MIADHGGMFMEFYTVVLRKCGYYWVALRLENGCAGQDHSRETAINNLKDAIDSIEEVRKAEPDISIKPLSINELHEFLTVESLNPVSMLLKMRTLYD